MTPTSSSDDGSEERGRRVATIERAADVLFLFAHDERPTLGVTEIADELNISKAVVHRILTSLKDRQLVAADPTTRKYSLGPAVLELSARYREQIDVRPMALEAMERLSRETNETATLSIRSGFDRIYIDQVTPALEVRMTVQTGKHYPLHAGSSSKAFLAFLSDELREEFLTKHALEALTEITTTNVKALRSELEEIRTLGYATSLGERQPGAGSVAAPIFDRDGPAAVISVCGPVERIRDRTEDIAALVLAETRLLSERLGYRKP